MNQPGSGPGHGRVVQMREHPIEEASLGMLYELVGDAISWIGRDGSIRAITKAMHELLSVIEAEVGRPVRFCTDLPFDRDDAQALKLLLGSDETEHEVVFVLRLRSGIRMLRARFCSEALQGGWFAVWHDETRLRRAEAEVLRLERLRVLGCLASGITHDFEHLLGEMLGMAEHLAQVTVDPDELRFLDEVRDSTRDGTAMVQRLTQLLNRSPIERVVVPLEDLVAQSLEFFRRQAVLRDVSVKTEIKRDLPKVRVVLTDAIAGLLQIYMLALETGKPITICAEEELVDAARVGLPTRRFGVVRVWDSGDPQVYAALAKACSSGEHGIANQLERLPEARVGILLSMLALQVHGGKFAAEPHRQGERGASLWFPAARGASRE